MQSVPERYSLSLHNADTIRLTGYAVLLLFQASAVFSAFVGDEDISSGNAVLLLGAFVAMLVVHELVHGCCFRAFGGRPVFGVGRIGILPYAYASASGAAFSLPQMLVITLAPLVLVSVAALLLAVLFLYGCGVRRECCRCSWRPLGCCHACAIQGQPKPARRRRNKRYQCVW